MKSSDISRIENLAFDGQALEIRWRVTTLCNYRCDFCIQGNREEHLRQARGESADTREAICRRLVEWIEAQKKFDFVKIALIGGEVTCLKDFPQLLKTLCECRFRGEISFHITTNFSQSAEYFKRLCDMAQGSAHRRRLILSASFYPEYTTREAFCGKLREIEEYARKISARRSPLDALMRRKADRRCFFSAGIPIFSDRDYEEFLDIRSGFEGTGVIVAPIAIRKYPTDISEKRTEDMLRFEKKSLRVTDGAGQEAMYQNIQALGVALEDGDSFRPTGYRCDAGVHNFWVDAFGNVKRCPAIGSTMGLGSLLDGSFHLLDEPSVCTSDHCSCSQFGRIEKVCEKEPI